MSVEQGSIWHGPIMHAICKLKFLISLHECIHVHGLIEIMYALLLHIHVISQVVIESEAIDMPAVCTGLHKDINYPT